MRLLSRAMQKALDEYLVSKGIPLLLLMESAGEAVARRVEMAKAPAVDLFIGPGMNGGDLYVAARKLAGKNRDIRVWEITAEPEGLSGQMRKAVLAVGVVCRPFSEYKPTKAVAVDGLLGTGFRAEREVSAELQEGFRALAAAKAAGSYVIACDLPSGIVTDSGYVHPLTVRANETVTFFAPKIGQLQSPACQYNGLLTVEDLGIPEAVLQEFPIDPDEKQIYAMDEAAFREALSGVSTAIHKGSQGSLCIIAGSQGMAGAARLAGEAALRCGTGLIRLVCPPDIYPELFAALPSLLYFTTDQIPIALTKADTILFGPGLGRGEDTKQLLADILDKDIPLVIDADGLYELAQSQELRDQVEQRKSLTVLTPHGGEAERLAEAYSISNWDKLERLERAEALAQASVATVVLKGEATVTVADAIYVNTSGGRGLAKGGSGDVLAGLIAGLLAQKAEQAVPAAVYWHGAAADAASERLGWRALAPTDTLAAFEEIARKLP